MKVVDNETCSCKVGESMNATGYCLPTCPSQKVNVTTRCACEFGQSFNATGYCLPECENKYYEDTT